MVKIEILRVGSLNVLVEIEIKVVDMLEKNNIFLKRFFYFYYFVLNLIFMFLYNDYVNDFES